MPACSLMLSSTSVKAKLHRSVGYSGPSLLQFSFIVVSALWALPARVISKLYVDHVLFTIGYILMLYFVFGWVMLE